MIPQFKLNMLFGMLTLGCSSQSMQMPEIANPALAHALEDPIQAPPPPNILLYPEDGLLWWKLQPQAAGHGYELISSLN